MENVQVFSNEYDLCCEIIIFKIREKTHFKCLLNKLKFLL